MSGYSDYRKPSWNEPGEGRGSSLNQNQQKGSSSTQNLGGYDFNAKPKLYPDSAKSKWGTQQSVPNEADQSMSHNIGQAGWGGSNQEISANRGVGFQAKPKLYSSEHTRQEDDKDGFKWGLSKDSKWSTSNQDTVKDEYLGGPSEDNQNQPIENAVDKPTWETNNQDSFMSAQINNNNQDPITGNQWNSSVGDQPTVFHTSQPQHNVVQIEELQYQNLSNTLTTGMQIEDPAFIIGMNEPLSDESIYAATSFEELHLKESLLKGIYNMNFSKPSKIQERALPVLLSDPPTNVICQSQSGTGKTVAFVLAMLQRVNVDLKAPQCICIAPTRELTRQIADVVVNMGKFASVTTALVIKESSTRCRPITEQIVIGTPGSLLYSLQRRYIATKNIVMFVLDEGDNMIEKDGLGDQSFRVKRLIQSSQFQILLFSATYSERILEFSEEFAPCARKLLLEGEKIVTSNIVQMYMDCNSLDHKYEVLCNLYDLLNVSQSIIFCKTRNTADEISTRMINQGHRVKCLHAGLAADERDKIIDEFRRGEYKVLIATNVVSRGIDIAQVSLVINYDTPLTLNEEPDMEVYIHRIGRTGRFGRKGASILFVHDEKTWHEINFIETQLAQCIVRIPTDDWEHTERMFKNLLH